MFKVCNRKKNFYTLLITQYKRMDKGSEKIIPRKKRKKCKGPANVSKDFLS